MDTVINSKKFRIEEDEKKSSRFIEFFKKAYYKIYRAFANSRMLGYIRSTIALLLPIPLFAKLFIVLSDVGKSIAILTMLSPFCFA